MGLFVLAKAILQDFAHGLIDACQWPKAFIVFYSSKKIQFATLKCLSLNGIALLGSLFFFRWILVPLLTQLYVISNTWIDEDTRWMHLWLTMLSMIYHTLWVYPIYLMSFTLNSFWYQHIAERVNIQKDQTSSTARLKKKDPGSYNLVYTLADELYRFLFCFLYLLLATFIYWLPYLGPPLSFLYFDALYAYYSFDYRWTHHLSFRHCLHRLEHHWAYFLGFGLPITLITFFLTTVQAGAVFAVVFPFYIILAHLAQPPKPLSLYPRLPIFVPMTRACDILLTLPLLYKRRKRN